MLLPIYSIVPVIGLLGSFEAGEDSSIVGYEDNLSIHIPNSTSVDNFDSQHYLKYYLELLKKTPQD